jgi:hypothetical protein
MASLLPLALLVVLSVQAVSPREKASRTPAQQKVSSQLLAAIRRAQNPPPPTPGLATEQVVKIDARQRALVDVRAAVTAAMKRTLVRLGATIVSTSIDADSLIAWVPLLKLEKLAEQSSVRAIQPAAEAIHK